LVRIDDRHIVSILDGYYLNKCELFGRFFLVIVGKLNWVHQSECTAGNDGI